MDETQNVEATPAGNIAPDNSAPVVDTPAVETTPVVDTPVVDTPAVETTPVVDTPAVITMTGAVLTENADGNEIITFSFSDGSTRIIKL